MKVEPVAIYIADESTETRMAHANALTRLQLIHDNSHEVVDLAINNVAPDISEDWTEAIQ